MLTVFLHYCLNEEDKFKIFTIASLKDTSPDLLRLVWNTNAAATELKYLSGKYAFFITDTKIHDVVQEYLVDYLKLNKSDDTVKLIAEKALPIYERDYRNECEEEPNLRDRFNEEMWRNATIKYINCKSWINPNDAIKDILNIGIELLLFNTSFIKKLIKIVQENSTKEDIRKNITRKLNLFIDVNEKFKWYSFSEVLNSFCKVALEEWDLSERNKNILLFIRARMKYHQGNYEIACEMYLVCDTTSFDTSLKKKYAESVSYLANKNYQIGFDNALLLHKKAIDNDTKNSLYYNNIGRFYLDIKDFDKAFNYAEKSKKIDELNKKTHILIGNIEQSRARFKEAIKNYKKVIEIDEKNIGAYCALANCYCYMGLYNKALETCHVALKIEPKNTDLLSCTSWIYIHYLNDYKNALSYAEKSLETDKDSESALYIMARIKRSKGAFNDAIKIYQQLKMKDPNDINYYVSLSICFSQNSQKEEAIQLAKELIELNPNSYSNSFLGYIYLCQNKNELAYESLQKGYELNTKDFDTLEPLCYICLLTEKLELAEKYCNQFSNVSNSISSKSLLALLFHIKEEKMISKDLFSKIISTEILSIENFGTKEISFLIIAYLSLEQYEKAQSILNDILSDLYIDSNFSIIFINYLKLLVKPSNVTQSLKDKCYEITNIIRFNR